MNVNPKDLQVYIFSGNAVCTEVEPKIYEETYLAWKHVWKQTFLELEGSDELFADGFSRQDKICTVFYKSKCIAIVGLKGFDFRYQSSLDDSIFSCWNQKSVESLIKDGRQVLACNNLSVHPDFRGEVSPGLTLKTFLIFLSVQMLLQSKYDVMSGTPRSDRKTNISAYHNGAQCIDKTKMHGVDVDLVVFYRRELSIRFKNVIEFTSEHLWNNRIDFTEKNLEISRTKKTG